MAEVEFFERRGVAGLAFEHQGKKVAIMVAIGSRDSSNYQDNHVIAIHGIERVEGIDYVNIRDIMGPQAYRLKLDDVIEVWMRFATVPVKVQQ